MKRVPVYCLALVTLVAIAPVARATTVTFDDLNSSNTSNNAIPNYYGGIIWGTNQWYWAPSGDYYQAVSAPNYAYVPLQLWNYAPSFTFAQPEVLKGAFFSGATGAPCSSGISIEFVLFSGGTQVAVSGLYSIGQTPTWVSSGYTGFIDMVEVLSFSNGGGGNITQIPAGFWVMDNLTFVPLPAPALLLATGLAFLGAIRKRPKSRNRPRPNLIE